MRYNPGSRLLPKSVFIGSGLRSASASGVLDITSGIAVASTDGTTNTHRGSPNFHTTTLSKSPAAAAHTPRIWGGLLRRTYSQLHCVLVFRINRCRGCSRRLSRSR